MGMLAAGALCAAVISVASRVPPDPPDEGDIPGVVIGPYADGGTPAPPAGRDDVRDPPRGTLAAAQRGEAPGRGAAGRDGGSGDAAPGARGPSQGPGARMAPAPSSPPADDDAAQHGPARPGGDDDGVDDGGGGKPLPGAGTQPGGTDDDRGASPGAREPADDDGAPAPSAPAPPAAADDGAPDDATAPASPVASARVEDHDEGPGGAVTAAPQEADED